MSGICDVFETTGETRCRKAFPPTQNLLTILRESLEGNKNKKQPTEDIIASWNTTLSNINYSRLREKEGTLELESKASAALAIIAIILDLITPFVAVSLRRASKPSLPYLLPLFSGLIAGAAGVLAVMSMKSGIHDLANNGEHGGAAIIVLFVGAALRILSCGGAARNPHPATDDVASAEERLQPPPGVPRNDWIGFLGENYIYALCGSHLPGWSYENWTSHLRKYAQFPEFLLPQSQFSDFTYTDPSGRMPGFLSTMGVPVSPHWSSNTKYHLEVKATPGHCGAEFYVSQYQARKMQEYAGDPNNAYLLTRVFNLGSSPDLRCFLDPWSHPALAWGEQRSDGDFPVRTKY
ncbi:hypothetical protein B0J18DRAFT_293451 [Chaetomium sp. MPI-SDFR-AT-0129]|nr:hypothetical protein B0J18DRAFT_293451 [Chaetomium sp. MPI-SDFR-AT-0129]